MVDSTDGGVSTDNTGMHYDDVDMEAGMTETVNFLPNVGDGEKDRDIFLTNLALFYLRMQAKILLPVSTTTLYSDRGVPRSMHKCYVPNVQ